jgi:aminomethyltransferase
MLKTIFNESHKQLGAKLVDFAGWEMPLSYGPITDEIKAVREGAGLFDVSHMGEFLVTGNQALNFVDYLITNNISALENGKAVYSPVCNHQGQILDDVICYKLGKDKILICVNASNCEKIYQWIKKESPQFECQVANLSAHYSLLALQGPSSREVLKRILGEGKGEQLGYYEAMESDFEDSSIVVSRTGYTGELGWEIFLPKEVAIKFWTNAIEAGARPCGLAARDILRLEVCYPLYGNELSEQLTPLDTGLKWTVDLNKDRFIGKEALSAHQSDVFLAKFTFDRPVPRSGYTITNEKEERIGTVSSGGFSPTLGKSICLAHINRNYLKETSGFKIEIRGKFYTIERTKKAFYQGSVQE